MDNEDLFSYKKINWKVLCHSKAGLNKIKWWYNNLSKEYWLFVLSQDCNKIFVINALSGKFIKSVGSSGDKVYELDKPVDMCIYEDYLLVLEEGNHRIQIFSLPDLKYISFLGEIELTNPKGIECIKVKKDKKEYCCIYVGDNLDNKPSRNKCYFRFIFEINNLGVYDVETIRVESKDNGNIGKIENILFNSNTNNLLIVDNMKKDIKEYTFDNKYKKSILKNSFKGEPGEIDMLSGNLIIGDFSRLDNFFYIFDKKFSNSLTLSSGDKTLKNKCFTIIDHDQNKILYSIDEDDCILAYRIYELGKDDKLKDNNKIVNGDFSSMTEIGAMGLLGTAVAAAFYLKK
jgi:hypothetical protein